MALLDGKQLRDQSTSLDKLRGYSGLVTFTASATMSFAAGSVLRQADENIIVGTDVVNKNYVDAVAQGLHIKESVHVIATSPITLSGTQTIDNHPLQAGERVLVNGQDNANPTASNGIYVVAAGAWSRATDSDGISTLPNGEVQLGDFVFVVEGDTYAGTGWVLNESDSSDFYILVGTESQHWTQFSAAGVITAGDGLGQLGNDFFVKTGTGLTISLDTVAIANTGVTASNQGSANSVAAFTVNAQGQILSAQSVTIDIPSTQVNDFAAAVENQVFDSSNFVDGSTLDFTVSGGAGTANSVTAEVKLGSLTASRFNIINSASASQGWKLGYNTTGQFEWFDPSQSDISEVIAGAGLTGGGVAGAVTVQIADTAAGNGLTFSAGVFAVNTANGLTINGDNVEINQTAAGNGLTFSSGVFAVNTANGLTINGDNVEIASSAAGTGLAFSSGVFNVNLGSNSGLTFSGDNIIVDTNIAGNGLDISNGVLTVNTSEITGSLAGNGLTANGTALDVNVNADSLEITGDVVRLKDTITGDRTFANNLTVSGDFTVSGTTTYVNTQNLYVEDNIITLNATFSGSPFLNAGIEVNRGNQAYSTLIWNETTDLWSAGLSGSEIAILLNAGTGLTKNGATVSLDYLTITGTGLTQNGTSISIDTAGFATALAGDGLAATGGTLSVNTSNGLTIIGDSVQINETAAGNGLTFSAGVFAVNTANGLTINGDNVEIASTAAGTGLGFSGGVFNVNLGINSGLTFSGDNIIVDTTIAGDGLDFNNGVLSVNVANGLSINGDDIEIDQTAAGNGLTFSAGVFAVNTANGLTVIGDNVQVAQTISGQGLTFSSGVIDMVWGGTASGTTFSNDAVAVVVDGTTIQINSSGQLTVVAGVAQPKYDRSPATATSGDGALATTSSLSATPNDYSRIQVFINGQQQRLGDGTKVGVDCYFSSDAGSTAKTLYGLALGDSLYWNGTIAGFNLASTDVVEIVYEA